jgi:protein phosphatase 1G
MSEDHKPCLPIERERIHRAGGAVAVQRRGNITQYRVNGGLNLSRSIGDLAYKQNQHLPAEEQMIVCTPDVRRFKRSDADEFMIICCDGVWDVLSSQEAVDWVRERLGNRGNLEARIQSGHLNLSSILDDMLDHCLSPDLQQTFGIGGDNMTAVLVVFGTKMPADANRAPSNIGVPIDDKRMLEHIEQHMPKNSWLCGASEC